MADPRDALEAGARQYLASLSDAQFNQLVAETREPKDPNEANPRPAPGADHLPPPDRRGTMGMARGRELYEKGIQF